MLDHASITQGNPKLPLAQQVVQAIQRVVGLKPVGLHEPYFAGNERSYLQECLDSTLVFFGWSLCQPLRG